MNNDTLQRHNLEQCRKGKLTDGENIIALRKYAEKARHAQIPYTHLRKESRPFLFPFAFFLRAKRANYGRGESGRPTGTPLASIFGRGESGRPTGTPLVSDFGRGESGRPTGTPLISDFGRGESGRPTGTPLAKEIAAFVAATAMIVMAMERKRRAFVDMTPP
jgi:hypothetical protein